MIEYRSHCAGDVFDFAERLAHDRVEVEVGKTPYARFDLNDYSIPHALVQKPLTLLASESRALRQWAPVHVHHAAAGTTGLLGSKVGTLLCSALAVAIYLAVLAITRELSLAEVLAVRRERPTGPAADAV